MWPSLSRTAERHQDNYYLAFDPGCSSAWSIVAPDPDHRARLATRNMDRNPILSSNSQLLTITATSHYILGCRHVSASCRDALRTFSLVRIRSRLFTVTDPLEDDDKNDSRFPWFLSYLLSLHRTSSVFFSYI